MVEHYTTILQFKPKNWVLCGPPTTLEDTIAFYWSYCTQNNEAMR